MKNKNLSVLLLAIASIMVASCGPGTQSTTTTTAAKTTVDSPTVSPPAAPATSFMSTSVYIYFGNPPAGNDAAPDKKDRSSRIKGFGTPSQNKDDSTGDGGTCVGKGICLPSAVPFPMATLVTFTISEDNPYVLVMSFSMKDLMKNQPNQYKFFSDPSGRYMFDGNFDLRLLFCPGLLPPGAMITPKSPSKLTLNKDIMTDVINYDHK